MRQINNRFDAVCDSFHQCRRETFRPAQSTDHVFEVGVGVMLLMTPITFFLGLPVLTTSVFLGWLVMTLMALRIRYDGISAKRLH